MAAWFIDRPLRQHATTPEFIAPRIAFFFFVQFPLLEAYRKTVQIFPSFQVFIIRVSFPGCFLSLVVLEVWKGTEILSVNWRWLISPKCTIAEKQVYFHSGVT